MTRAALRWIIPLAVVGVLFGAGAGAVRTAMAVPVDPMVTVCIYDSNNTKVVPTQIRYSYGSNTTGTAYFLTGSEVSDCIEATVPLGTPAQATIRAKYGLTESAPLTQAVSSGTNTVFNFYMAGVTLRFETCESAPLEDGYFRFGRGVNYGEWYFPDDNASTRTDTSGEITGDLFPGDYSFQIKYLNNQEGPFPQEYTEGNPYGVKMVTIPGPPTSTTVGFQATFVGDDLPAFGGTPPASFGGPDGTYHAWSPQLLPVGATYVFKWANGTTEEIVIPDCPVYGSLKVSKLLFPWYDSGRFDLLIDGQIEAASVGNYGSTGFVQVEAGQHSVSEIATNTSLSNYRTTVVCFGDGGFKGYGFSSSLTVDVGEDEEVSCRFINQRIFNWFWWW